MALLGDTENPKQFIKPAEWNNDIYGFVKNKHYISGGMGFINLSAPLAYRIKNTVAPNWDELKFSNRPIFFIKAERAINKRSGIGFTFANGGFDITASLDSLTSENIKVQGKLAYRTSSYLFRYNFHFFPEKAFDLYLGAAVGLRTNRFKLTDNDPENSYWKVPLKIGWVKKYIPTSYSFATWGGDFTVGMRYHILPPIAVYMELGLAKSVIQGGVTFRL